MGEPKLAEALVLDADEMSFRILRAARAIAIADHTHVIEDVEINHNRIGAMAGTWYYLMGKRLAIVGQNAKNVENCIEVYSASYTKTFTAATAAGPQATLDFIASMDRLFERNWEKIQRKYSRARALNRSSNARVDAWLNRTYQLKVTADIALVILSPLAKLTFLKGALQGIGYTIACKIAMADPSKADVVALSWDKAVNAGGEVVDVGQDFALNRVEKAVKDRLVEHCNQQFAKASTALVGTHSAEEMLKQMGSQTDKAIKAAGGVFAVAGLLFMKDDLKRAFVTGYANSRR